MPNYTNDKTTILFFEMSTLLEICNQISNMKTLSESRNISMLKRHPISIVFNVHMSPSQKTPYIENAYNIYQY